MIYVLPGVQNSSGTTIAIQWLKLNFDAGMVVHLLEALDLRLSEEVDFIPDNLTGIKKKKKLLEAGQC